MRYVATALALIAVVSGVAAQSSPQPAASSATVPVTLDHNRVIIDVYFPMADGTKLRTRAWVDPGDPEISITQALQEKLGLQKGEGSDQKHVPAELLIGDFKVDLSAARKTKAYEERSIAPGSSANIKIPATVLRNYDVAIDYPNREFTIGQPGSLRFEGSTVKASVGAQTGLIQVQANIGGERYAASFDPGTSVSLLAGDMISKWHQHYAQWPSMIGGVGTANLWGWQDEAKWLVLRIPQIDLGEVRLNNGVAASFPKEYIGWFQERAGVATIGVIGADVLQNFRVGMDYAHATVYFSQGSKYTPPGIDVVGLTLRPEADGRYTVIGIADYNGAPSVPEVKSGDVLVMVDGARVSGGTMGQAWSLLGGSPGDTRTLIMERDGKQFTVKAPVRRFLPAVTSDGEKARTRSRRKN